MSGHSPLWWLSFCDADRPKGQQFLGACMVVVPHASSEQEGLKEALRMSHLLRINPGGDVQALLCPEEARPWIPAGWVGRLLSREDCATFEEEVAAAKRAGTPPEEP